MIRIVSNSFVAILLRNTYSEESGVEDLWT
jgi:hypothetical protein